MKLLDYPSEHCLASDLSTVPMMDGHLGLMMGHLQGFDLVRHSGMASNLALNWVKLLAYPLDHCLALD